MSPPDLKTLGCALAARDALGVRAWLVEAHREPQDWRGLPDPRLSDPLQEAAVAAALELLAERAGQESPEWTARVPGLTSPHYLVAAAETMPRLRALCDASAPGPFRIRNLFVPPDFLSAA